MRLTPCLADLDAATTKCGQFCLSTRHHPLLLYLCQGLSLQHGLPVQSQHEDTFLCHYILTR